MKSNDTIVIIFEITCANKILSGYIDLFISIKKIVTSFSACENRYLILTKFLLYLHKCNLNSHHYVIF